MAARLCSMTAKVSCVTQGFFAGFWSPMQPGSAPTKFRCGGKFYFTVFRSLPANPKVKELLKWSTFAKLIVKIKVATFDGPR